MKKVEIAGRVIMLYESIDEMPIMNFQKYNKCLLIDAGIGSDIDDIDQHIIKIAKYIKSDKEKAIQELQNMRQNLFMISSSISPKYLAFASLIHSIDGEVVKDLSDSNLQAILENLKTVKHTWLIELLAKLKKKISTELELYFPSDFVNPKEREVYDKLKIRALLVLEGIKGGENKTSEIDSIDAYLFSLHKPNSFSGASSAEIKYDKQFESMCVLIAQKTSMDAKAMTVLQFYSALDNIRQQAEAERKMINKHKK